jgi:hypothetical protein
MRRERADYGITEEDEKEEKKKKKKKKKRKRKKKEAPLDSTAPRDHPSEVEANDGRC